ncbi:MAG: phosphatase PAP2 family protein [Candidatus Eisenbacteria bacterium]
MAVATLTGLVTPPPAGAAVPADTTAHAAPAAWDTPRDPDLLLGALAAGAFTLAATHDLEITRRVREAPPSTSADNAARAFRQLGDPVVLGTALAATWGAARLAHAPGLARATVRIGVSIAVPSIACLVLKESIGRMRPKESPDDAWRFDPFSGDASLPSGHTTVAFAAAAALDRETTARWVPWVAYPAAAACGWSRVHDLEHWTSDVVAGAALGYWGGRMTDDFMRRRDAGAGRLSFMIVPTRAGTRVSVTRRF